MIARLGTEALLLAVWLSLPVLLAVIAVGLLVGILQAATQIQDSSIAFVPKLLVAVLVLAVSATWMGRELIAFTIAAWSSIG